MSDKRSQEQERIEKLESEVARLRYELKSALAGLEEDVPLLAEVREDIRRALMEEDPSP